MPGRPCPLYATIFYAATKDRFGGPECGTDKINPAFDLLGVLTVGDEHRVEVLKFVNIRQGDLALLVRDEC